MEQGKCGTLPSGIRVKQITTGSHKLTEDAGVGNRAQSENQNGPKLEQNITIQMPQRTSKILLVRLTANKNAPLFQKRVTCFARYTV